KTSIFSHPVYLFLRKFSLQDSRGGSQTSFLAARVTVAVADHQPMVEPAESHLLDLYLIVMFPLSVLIPLFIF
ncbi:hypothetical protein, partial [Escherichia coli]|uniref:hypothetical protein n=1 Tax=Escherichia coli TaxID=562 RepID=UPI002864E5CE